MLHLLFHRPGSLREIGTLRATLLLLVIIVPMFFAFLSENWFRDLVSKGYLPSEEWAFLCVFVTGPAVFLPIAIIGRLVMRDKEREWQTFFAVIIWWNVALCFMALLVAYVNRALL
jgi:hypothetical protein